MDMAVPESLRTQNLTSMYVQKSVYNESLRGFPHSL
jgi:hypothetical protein